MDNNIRIAVYKRVSKRKSLIRNLFPFSIVRYLKKKPKNGLCIVFNIEEVVVQFCVYTYSTNKGGVYVGEITFIFFFVKKRGEDIREMKNNHNNNTKSPKNNNNT